MTSKEIPSFSVTFANFFIGLVRGHPFLQPLSGEVRQLGYSLFQLEPSFVTKGGRVNPDAIVISAAQSHTLIAEWTHSSVFDEKKRQQVIRYCHIGSQELIDSAAVPRRCAGRKSVWFIAPAELVAGYAKAMPRDVLEGVFLSACSTENGLVRQIEPCAGSLKDPKLKKLLTKRVEVRRIPMGYVRVTMDDMSARAYVRPVVQEIVSIVAKGKSSFSCEDICAGLFSVWKHIGAERKKAVRRAVSEVLKLMSKDEFCQGWLFPSPSPTVGWRVEPPKGKMLKEILPKLQRFAQKVTDKEHQLVLFND
jgi:hypothetical protein